MPRSIIQMATVLTILMLVTVIAASAPRTFTEADSGSLVVAKKGEAFKVILAENPSTGYAWNMTVSGGLEIVGDRYVPQPRTVPGKGGYHEWTILAAKPGQQKVRGIYMRPGAPIRYNETTFRLDLEVTGSLASNAFPDMSGNAINIRSMLGNIASPDTSTPSLNFKSLIRI